MSYLRLTVKAVRINSNNMIKKIEMVKFPAETLKLAKLLIPKKAQMAVETCSKV